MRPLLGLLAVAGCLSCANVQPDLRPWQESARAIRLGMESHFLELAGLLQGAESEQAMLLTESLESLVPGHRRCDEGWKALEAYGAQSLAGLEAHAFESEGIEEQVLALAALHRSLLASGAARNDPFSYEHAQGLAQEMRAAHDGLAAFAAANRALELFTEEIALTHREHAAAVAAVEVRCVELHAERRTALEEETRACASVLARIEAEMRMEAAGAGLARPDAARAAAENRERLTRLQTQLAAVDAQDARLLVGIERYRDRIERTAVAVNEWAIAHREAARAARAGRPVANFSLLQASAAELGVP